MWIQILSNLLLDMPSVWSDSWSAQTYFAQWRRCSLANENQEQDIQNKLLPFNCLVSDKCNVMECSTECSWNWRVCLCNVGAKGIPLVLWEYTSPGIELGLSEEGTWPVLCHARCHNEKKGVHPFNQKALWHVKVQDAQPDWCWIDT